MSDFYEVSDDLTTEWIKKVLVMPIKRRKPALPGEPDYSKFFYVDPPSHDFCVGLIIAEMMRRHHGASSPLKVRLGLIEGQLGIVDWGPLSPWSGRAYQCGVSRKYSDEMIANVLRPAMEMIGAVEEFPVHAPFDPRLLTGYVEYDYHIGHLVDASRAGFVVPKFTPPQWAHDEVKKFLGGRKPIVITLRETPAQPERNSRIDEWLKFARSIDSKHDVMFVRDTCRADEWMDPFVAWPRASKNAYVRAALYQHALVNMFVCNGPTVWCMFSDAPYLMFKQLVPELKGWAHGQPSGWKDQDHLEVGDQWPWALPTQRMTWTDDTFENISSAFEGFIAQQSKQA